MAEIRQCDNCSKPIDVPAHALNKRFCSDSCRNAWHTIQLRALRAELREKQQKEAGEQL